MRPTAVHPILAVGVKLQWIGTGGRLPRDIPEERLPSQVCVYKWFPSINLAGATFMYENKHNHKKCPM